MSPLVWSLGLILTMAAGGAIRAWHVGAQSLWLDEALFLQAAVQPTISDLVQLLVEQDSHPPAYPLLLRFWVKIAGMSDAAVRALPLIFGVLLLPATAWLARILTGRRDIGLCAAVVAAFNGYHVYLSQEGRQYTWLALVGVVHVAAFIRLLGGGHIRWWVVFVISGIVGLFSHYHMMLIFAGEALLVLPRTSRRVVLPAIALCLVVFFALWGHELGVQTHRRSRWGEGLIDPVGFPAGVAVVCRNLCWTVLDFSVGSYVRLVGGAGLDPPDVLKLAVGVAVAAIALRGTIRLAEERAGVPVLGVLVFLGVLPVAGAIASGFFQANSYETKYVSFVAPLWAVVLGAGCRVALTGWGGRAAAATLLCGLGLSVAYFHTEAVPWKEDWRRAAKILTRHWRDSDALLQRAPYTAFSLTHYLPFQPATLTAGTARVPSPAMADSVRREAHERNASRLWVVLSHDEHATEAERVLGAVMPLKAQWTLTGIRIARFGVQGP